MQSNGDGLVNRHASRDRLLDVAAFRPGFHVVRDGHQQYARVSAIAEPGAVDCAFGDRLSRYAANSTSAARMTGRSRGSAAIPIAVLA